MSTQDTPTVPGGVSPLVAAGADARRTAAETAALLGQPHPNYCAAIVPTISTPVSFCSMYALLLETR